MPRLRMILISPPPSDWFDTDYIQDCAASGFPLTMPTITPNPSRGNGPMSITQLVPFGTKSTLSKSGSGTTLTTGTAAPVTCQPAQSASSLPPTSGAIGVGDRAEVMSMLFSLCLMVALLA